MLVYLLFKRELVVRIISFREYIFGVSKEIVVSLMNIY